MDDILPQFHGSKRGDVRPASVCDYGLACFEGMALYATRIDKDLGKAAFN